MQVAANGWENGMLQYPEYYILAGTLAKMPATIRIIDKGMKPLYVILDKIDPRMMSFLTRVPRPPDANSQACRLRKASKWIISWPILTFGELPST